MAVEALNFDSCDIVKKNKKDKVLTVKSVGSNSERIMYNDSLRCYPTPLICDVPEKILFMMRSIEKKAFQNLEFGAFLKGELSSNGHVVVEDAFYVPRQKVSGAAIDFLEEPPEGYNGVIHRHPSGVMNFSGDPRSPYPSTSVDAGSINQNFTFSLLYVNNNIHLGIYNIQTVCRIQVPLVINVMFPIREDIDDLITKIQPSHPATVSHYSPVLPANYQSRQENFMKFGDLLEDVNMEIDGIEDDEEDEDIIGDDIYICDNCGITGETKKCENCGKVLNSSNIMPTEEDDEE